uniref:MD-2-related lipid-recognition domain-containing protein n=1 Tax=Bicosoecida sp. CB-2014 TaxID=1486930 RepID=A0A7S1GBK6_9STRA|mmetsp:Transcript_4897/g.17756  ORF Transcript_4897/g.17756 Transcript_4897/m.17756 type:complete len:162 (+) Transcript_4897:81-566(+)|eukprot:CAMPEP_0203812854 /NCGR_PEP_ID=MMETSP0115-20131106/4378_1 /ASSEMBLY_ACC=CAM_ASM_000227 /TAXON_ID=33651 /ORGANISM="Bicosoecid sp, Strain ms1" /LENGTH=161 /DNA_ID=CAMNT_0050721705 /DNA_START=94 /DNA_END=579 /DNA_ORIENTATION=+
MRSFVAVALAAVALAALAAPALAGAGSITDCGAGKAKASFSTLTITPDPPVKGSLTQLNATGTISEAATGGKYSIAVSLDKAQLYTHSGNVCGTDKINLPLGFGTITYVGPTCPTTSGGAFKIGISLVLPSAAPSGNYDVKITGADSGGADMYCIDAAFPL